MPSRIRLLSLFLVVQIALLLLPSPLPVEARKKSRSSTITRTFVNTGQIAIPATASPNSLGPAQPFPAGMQVGGFKSGKITEVNLTLNGFGHHWPADVDILLVAPNGRQALVLSDVGSFVAPTAPVTDLTLTLDDEAARAFAFGEKPTSGAFKPTNIEDFDGTDDFPAPAPLAGGNAALSVFDGGDANGQWQLFVNDDVRISTGSISGGWELEITAKVKKKKK